MAVKPVQLFSTDPGHLTDFSGFNIADVFNKIAVQRANMLEQQFGSPDDGEDDLPPLRQRQQPSAVQPDAAPYTQAREMLSDDDSDFDPPAEQQPVAPVEPPEDYSRPAAGSTRFEDPADFTFNSEAQHDSQGNLRVYTPPSGDGGGAFEVAGITAKYQPREAARLRQMVEAGDTAGAEAYAKDFYRRRAAPFSSKTANQGLRLQFADTVHHRGEGGLRRVLQRATGSDAEDYGELITALDGDPKALEAFHRARQDYEWEEVDRGRESRKKFRRGLQNRFNKAYQASLQY